MPRKVGQDEDEPASGDSQSESNGQSPHRNPNATSDLTPRISRLTISTEPVVRRPALANRPKKTSALRMSFGPDEADDAEDEGSAVVKPKKKKPLGRLVVERSAEKAASSGERSGQEFERPSYNKEYLEELKMSTPSTPQNFSDGQTSEEVDLEGAMIVDTNTGSGALVKDGKPVILSQSEIRERKDRRARLAAEQKAEEFISLDDDNQYLDEESGQLVLRPADKYVEGRLIREDEDVLEGFDDYTEDSRLHFGRKAQREARKKKRKAMADAIAAAEGDDEDMDEDNSEAERNAAYDAAQARKGTYGLHRTDEQQEYRRPRTPPIITPIPALGDIIREIREEVEAKKADIERMRQRREELAMEKSELEESEKYIQEQLNEAAKTYEKLMGGDGAGKENAGDVTPAINGDGVTEENGHADDAKAEDDEEMDEDEEDHMPRMRV